MCTPSSDEVWLATRLIVAGLAPLSVALVLAAQLVVSAVVAAQWVSWAVAGGLALAILVLWWVVPTRRHARLRGP